MKQLTIANKIIIGCSLPLILTIIVSMFAILGFQQIGQSNKYIKEKIIQSQSIENNKEMIIILEKSEKKIESFKILIMSVTILSILIGTMTTLLIARSINAQ